MIVSDSIPSGLAALTAGRAIGTGDWVARGRLELRVDGRRRIRIRRGRRGDEIVLEARLASLPPSARDCEALLARAMLRVTAGAGHQVGTLALSADGGSVLLQAQAGAGDARQFNTALESFLNEADYWGTVLGATRS